MPRGVSDFSSAQNRLCEHHDGSGGSDQQKKTEDCEKQVHCVVARDGSVGVEDVSIGAAGSDSSFDACAAFGATSLIACPFGIRIKSSIGIAAAEKNRKKTALGFVGLRFRSFAVLAKLIIAKSVDVHDVFGI